MSHILRIAWPVEVAPDRVADFRLPHAGQVAIRVIRDPGLPVPRGVQSSAAQGTEWAFAQPESTKVSVAGRLIGTS